MHKNSINQNFTSLEQAIHCYILALEQGNMDNVALVLEAAVDDLQLEQIIMEINLEYQQKEQLMPIAMETEVISDLLSEHNLAREQPDEQLKCLVAQACKHVPASQERQKLLTQIIRLSSSKLWKESTPYYQDALQQTWLYFCRNVCEGLTGQTYDPAYGSVITWLNAYLKRRLQDFYLNQYKEQATTVPIKVRQSGSGVNCEVIDPVDNLSATPQTPPILEELEAWVKTDPDGELRSTHIKGHPQVNCRILILKRLPPEVSWKELSEEFGLPISTLSSFYQRQCLPRLRKFAQLQGWL